MRMQIREVSLYDNDERISFVIGSNNVPVRRYYDFYRRIFVDKTFVVEGENPTCFDESMLWKHFAHRFICIGLFYHIVEIDLYDDNGELFLYERFVRQPDGASYKLSFSEVYA